jgi:hypothetical protein
LPASRIFLAAALAAALSPQLSPAQPASSATPASAASAAAAPASAVLETTDPSRAAAVLKEARAIGDRNARVAKFGGPPPSAVLVRGKTDDGTAFLSGGVTVDDRKTMHAERAEYTLWVATVAKRSGAYLSDVRLRITRAGDKAPVIERTMDGPWLLAALPAGRYEIVATMAADGPDKEQTIKTQVQLAKGGQRQAVLRFDSAAELSPDGSDPFKGNPFGAAPAAKKK